MYGTNNSIRSYLSRYFRSGTQCRRYILSIVSILCSLKSPAFLWSQNPVNPYENARFQRAYAAVQQPSIQVAENVSWRLAIASWERASGVSTWLDRRLDGEQLVSLAGESRDHWQALQALCDQTKSESVWIENLIYIAPSGHANKIENGYWQLFSLTESNPWRKTSVDWDMKSSITAEDFFQRLQKDGSTKIRGLDLIPMDRWPARSLPSTSLAALWTCGLAGFEKTLRRNGAGQWEVISLENPEPFPYVYDGRVRKLPKERVQAWRQQWPQAQITTLRNGSFQVTALAAAHRDLSILMAATFSPKWNFTSSEDKRLELTIEGSCGIQLPALAKQLGMELKPWPIPDAYLNQRISLDVKNVTLDELLDQLGRQTKLQLRVEGSKTIVVQPLELGLDDQKK
jgi:hypothetical protein